MSRGRPEVVLSSAERESVLRQVEAGQPVDLSAGLFQRLFVDRGQVALVPVHSGGRGRPSLVPQVTRKGKEYLRLNALRREKRAS